MATNEQIRRAIGANNEATRRSFADDLNRLVNSGAATKTLRTIEPRGARPAAVGVGAYKAPSSSIGGGIASPLTEKTKVVDGKALPDREFWPGGYLTTDGMLVMLAPKTVNMTDADGASVVFNYANPKGVAVVT